MADGVQLTGAGVQLVPDAGGGGGGGGTPGGPNNSVQFNNNGALDGSAAFAFNGSTSQVAFGVRPTFAGNTPYDTDNLDLSGFLTITSAAATYLTIANAASTYETPEQTDAKYLPFSGGTITGPLVTPEVDVSGAPGTIRQTGFTSAGSFRWAVGAGNSTETGSNAGSNFNVWRYGDDSKVIDSPISIVRSTGVATFTQRPMFGANTPWDSGNLDPTSFLSANGGTIDGNLNVSGSEVVGGRFSIDGPESAPKWVQNTTAGVFRWQFGTDSTAENGNNEGSDFRVLNYSDAGDLLGEPFTITRATGVSTFSVRPVFGAATPWDSENLSPSSFLPNTGGTVNGDVTVTGILTSDTQLAVSNTTAIPRLIAFQTSGANRWQLGATNNGESGANSGSDFQLIAYADNGSIVSTALQIKRSTGVAAFAVRPTFNGNIPWDSGNLVPGSFITQTQGDARYLQLTGGVMTGPVSNGQTGAAAVASLAIANADGSGRVSFYPDLPAGAFNATVQAGDAAIIGGATNGAAAGMVIGLWGSSTPALRVSPAGVALSARPTFAGNTAWDSGNFSPANFLSLNGGTLNGTLTAPAYTLSAAAGTWKPISFNTGASQRWQLGSDNAGESGNNAGANFQLFAYSDGGGVLSNPLTITRATGVASFASRPIFAGNTPWDSGNFNPAQYLTLTAAAATYTTPAEVNTALASFLTIANAATMYFPLAGGALHGPLSNLTAGNSQVQALSLFSGDNASQTNFYPSMTAGGVSSAGFLSNSMVQAGDAAWMISRPPAGSSAAIVIGVASLSTLGSPAGIRISGNGNGGAIAMGVRPTFAGNLAWDAGNLNTSIFLTTANAATTYLTIPNAAATYLTPAQGDARYLPIGTQEVVVPVTGAPQKYVANQVIFQQILKAPVAYGTNFGGGFAYCQAAPVSATTVFVENILANGTVNVNFEGQIAFAAGSTVGALSLAPGAVTLAAGTMIRFRASATADSAFAGFMATLVGK